jgi:hypothetical protein
MPIITITWELKIRRVVVLGQPRQNVSKIPMSTKKLNEVAHIPPTREV